MTTRRELLIGTAAVLLSVSSAIGAAPPRRSFHRFAYDSQVADGVWAEIAVARSHFQLEDDSGTVQVDTTEVVPTLAYGNGSWEAGLIAPYADASGELCPSAHGCLRDHVDGIEDLLLYGRYVWQLEQFRLGGGVDFSLPSGDSERGLGSGEFGSAPFATAGIAIGEISLQTHVGNRFYTGDDSNPRHPVDVLFYGAGIFTNANESIGLRAEILGRRFDRHDEQNWLAIEPGVDVRIPLGTLDLLIRPTASFGLTDVTPEWSVGGGIVVSKTQS